MRRGLFGLLLCVLLAVPAWAQETRGAIEGAVRDASGGVLPGVSVEAAGAAGLLSADHFTVDGTLLRSLRRSAELSAQGCAAAQRRRSGTPMVDFCGQRRSNETHYSTTDPDSRLFRKADGQPSRLAYNG